jgi:hypothetical protein
MNVSTSSGGAEVGCDLAQHRGHGVELVVPGCVVGVEVLSVGEASELALLT